MAAALAVVAAGGSAAAWAAGPGPAAPPAWRLKLAIHYLPPVTNRSQYDAVVAEPGQTWLFGGSDVGGHGKPEIERITNGVPHAAGLPAGAHSWIAAASAPAPSDIWAVTYLGGTVLHWNGSAWAAAPRGGWRTGTRFTGITAVSPSDVWVFGTAGRRYPAAGTWHLSGTAWTRVRGAAAEIAQASKAGPGDLWAVGNAGAPGNGLFRSGGRSWRRVRPAALAGFSYSRVLALGPRDVWVTGSVAGTPKLGHYDGRGWTLLTMPGTTIASGLCRDGRGGLWVIANSGRLRRRCWTAPRPRPGRRSWSAATPPTRSWPAAWSPAPSGPGARARPPRRAAPRPPATGTDDDMTTPADSPGEPASRAGPAPVPASVAGPMQGRVCVLTGASSGIGLAASVALARLGASMVLICRDRARGEAALAQVAEAGAGGRAELELADLARLDQVRDLAGRLSRRPRIDVLINNAGSVNGRREVTEDGYERTFAVNHLAPFLLTNLLLPALTASAPARVITVSSVAHRGALMNLGNLQLEHGYLPMRAYANSKLANIWFTRELARRLAGTGVTANCLHPGTVRTHFGDTGAAWLRLGLVAACAFLRTPQSGAATTVYLASSPAAGDQTGGYFVDSPRRRPSRAARDDERARRLWDISARLTALPRP